MKKFFKTISVSILILLLFFDFPAVPKKLNNPDNHISEHGVQIISWMSINMPLNSKIIIVHEQYLIYGITTMTFATKEYLEVIFKKWVYNQTEFNNLINTLKEEKFQYLLFDDTFTVIYPNATLVINEFYNITLYECGNLKLCYAPYFD